MAENNDFQNSKELETFWFIARGDVMKGPFTVHQIAEKVSRRELSALDYCWRQGFSEWRPINSVEEFDRRGKIKALSPYPTIEIPGNSGPRDLSSRNTPVSPGEQHKIVKRLPGARREKIEVTFAKVRKGPLSIYEWAGALTFCLIFAFLTAHFALTEVEDRVLKKLAWIELGKVESQGALPLNTANGSEIKVTPVWMWEPLLSAPGVKAIDQVQSLPREIGIPFIERTYVGFIHQRNEAFPFGNANDDRSPASQEQSGQLPLVNPHVGGYVYYRGALKIGEKLKVGVVPQGSPDLP
jgi:hypothetical protein